MNILVFNAGSSSYKLALYEIDKGVLGQPKEPIWQEAFDLSSDSDADRRELKRLLAEIPYTPTLIAHRIVHGGSRFVEPTPITAAVKQGIADLLPLAPLHNAASLRGIESLEREFPGVPQLAVFDTAFHSNMSEVASTYPGPYHWKELGIRRFGFHGISYHYCLARVAALLNQETGSKKIVLCHLGNGASMAAVSGGCSIDTTMGFTPLDGLMMGTRCGSLDPGILLYLEKEHGLDERALSHTLNFDSGLKGISGATHDMRKILQMRAQGTERATLAYEMYVHSLKRNLGAMIGVLGGIDLLIFTGGIGEHCPEIRGEVCATLEWSGLKIDPSKNQTCQSDGVITCGDSTITAMVIATQEDWCVATQALSFRGI